MNDLDVMRLGAITLRAHHNRNPGAGSIPTVADLEAAGADAGALLDAAEAELERACAAAQDKATRRALSDDVNAVQAMREAYFRIAK